VGQVRSKEPELSRRQGRQPGERAETGGYRWSVEFYRCPDFMSAVNDRGQGKRLSGVREVRYPAGRPRGEYACGGRGLGNAGPPRSTLAGLERAEANATEFPSGQKRKETISHVRARWKSTMRQVSKHPWGCATAETWGVVGKKTSEVGWEVCSRRRVGGGGGVQVAESAAAGVVVRNREKGCSDVGFRLATGSIDSRVSGSESSLVREQFGRTCRATGPFLSQLPTHNLRRRLE